MTDDESTSAPRWFDGSEVPGPFDAPPPSVDVAVEFGARSRRSPLRSVNDDHYLIVRLRKELETLLTSLPDGDIPKRFDEYGYGMVIADGMGDAGEASSRLAISTLVYLAIYFGKGHVRVDEPIAHEMMDRFERFYRSIDSTLLQVSHHSPSSLRSTLTAVYTVGNELFFAHVGHSRAYVLRGDQLIQLTRDHTIDSERPCGAVSLDVGGGAPDLYHMVTETLGGVGRRIDIERTGLMDGDVVLLCTNGLTDVVEDAPIANTLRLHRTPDDQCRALVDLAAASGGNDDVTALVAHYRICAGADASDARA